MHELKELWTTTIGLAPTDEQFALWLAMHEVEVIRTSILKTAARNLQVGRTMTPDHLLRFASKVMLTRTERREEFRRQHFGKGPSRQHSRVLGIQEQLA
jgi:hypothetical protein